MAEDYLRDVSERLRVTELGNEQIIRELRSHLQASQYDLELSGCPPERAAQESVRRFGDPDDVAEMLSLVHRRRAPRFGAVLVLTIALGGLSAWLGTSGTFAALNQPRHHTHALTRHSSHVQIARLCSVGLRASSRSMAQGIADERQTR